MAVIPASVSCLKKATFESPLRVLITHEGLAALIFETIVAKSVCPIGVYSSPATVPPIKSSCALMILLAVLGNT